MMNDDRFPHRDSSITEAPDPEHYGIDDQIRSRFRDALLEPFDDRDFDALESRVMKIVDEKRKRRRNPFYALSDMILSARVLVPMTACALLFFMLTVFFKPMPSEPTPSAIVDSFKGNIASVMILETPQTHQTIIWYKESF